MSNDAELLARAIRASGLSTNKFAEQVLVRDARQVRRWLAGKPLPVPVRAYLEARLEEQPTRAWGWIPSTDEPTRKDD